MHTLVVGDDQFEVVDAYARSMLASPLDALMIKESASGSVVTFNDGADDVALQKCLIDIVPLQAGSGDPSPSNIRAISGWTGANVAVTGKNIFNEALAGWVNNYTITAEGVITSSSGYRYTGGFTKVKPETTYMAQLNVSETNNRSFMVAFYDENQIFISRTVAVSYSEITASTGVKSGSFTTPSGCVFIRLVSPRAGMSDYQVEEGSTKTDYEAYAHNYPVTWESKAGTIYAGTLDVLSGILTKTHEIYDLGDASWGLFDDDDRYVYRTLGAQRAYGDDVEAWCSGYKFAGNGGSSEIASMANKTLVFSNASYATFIRDDSITTESAFKTAVTGMKLVYPLATPVAYQLDPVVIASLLGLNNIWADTGDADVIYVADTKTYIDNNGGSDLPSASGVNF